MRSIRPSLWFEDRDTQRTDRVDDLLICRAAIIHQRGESAVGRGSDDQVVAVPAPVDDMILRRVRDPAEDSDASEPILPGALRDRSR
jgi:hypothetical protein